MLADLASEIDGLIAKDCEFWIKTGIRPCFCVPDKVKKLGAVDFIASIVTAIGAFVALSLKDYSRIKDEKIEPALSEGT